MRVSGRDRLRLVGLVWAFVSPAGPRGNDIDGASMLFKRHGWSIDVFHAAPRTRAAALMVPE
jgi:hypothetical protein